MPASIRIHLDHTQRTGMLYYSFRAFEHDDAIIINDYILVENAFPLDSSQYWEIKRAFFRYRFWQTPTFSTSLRHMRGRLVWVIEGADSSRYHAVSRLAHDFGNTAKLGQFLFDYADNLLYEAGYGDKYIIFV